jgi:Mg-chelatase subunit ChlD
MLVQFASSASRFLPLTRSSKNNRDKITAAINSLSAGGGTNIASGMKLALKGIRERKY